MLENELEAAELQDGFFQLLSSRPLDDFLDPLEEALEQKAAALGSVEGDAFRALKTTIRELRNRDFALDDEDSPLQ